MKALWAAVDAAMSSGAGGSGGGVLPGLPGVQVQMVYVMNVEHSEVFTADIDTDVQLFKDQRDFCSNYDLAMPAVDFGGPFAVPVDASDALREIERGVIGPTEKEGSVPPSEREWLARIRQEMDAPTKSRIRSAATDEMSLRAAVFGRGGTARITHLQPVEAEHNFGQQVAAFREIRGRDRPDRIVSGSAGNMPREPRNHPFVVRARGPNLRVYCSPAYLARLNVVFGTTGSPGNNAAGELRAGIWRFGVDDAWDPGEYEVPQQATAQLVV